MMFFYENAVFGGSIEKDIVLNAGLALFLLILIAVEKKEKLLHNEIKEDKDES